MPLLKLTHNVKPKRTEETDIADYESLINYIDTVFLVERKKITITKPRIKDQTSFAKEAKPGIEIIFLGPIRKEKTAEELEKEKKMHEDIERIQKQLRMTDHQRLEKKLAEMGIDERPIEYLNPDTRKPEDLGIQYALLTLHVLKACPQFYNAIIKYKHVQRNPDGLIVEQLQDMFVKMTHSKTVISPLDWISAWITYCADDIEFPYPTYDVNYFYERLFMTMKVSHEVELEKREEEPNSRLDIATKYFGVQYLTKRLEITQLDDDDSEENKEYDKKIVKYTLECDFSKPETVNLITGIKERFKDKNLWLTFYGFDVEYREKILGIERLPKFLLIHGNRWGYPPAREEFESIDLYDNHKSYHRIRIPRVLDGSDLCENHVKEKLEAGRYERMQMFYPYEMEEGFEEFKKNLKNVNEMTDTEIRYAYFETKLYEKNIFHEFYFEQIKNSKRTGEFLLIGMILHKGQFYHVPNPDHDHGAETCTGEFMAFTYRRGRQWCKFYRGFVEVIDVNEAMDEKYWGVPGEWTVHLYCYKEIMMKNVQLEPIRDPKVEKQRLRDQEAEKKAQREKAEEFKKMKMT